MTSMRGARPTCTLLAALAVAGLLTSSAAAGGRWTTLAKPYRYLSLLASGDTVWCGTFETGLLRLQRNTGRFEVF